ncbi:MAG: serine/threonine protein kinase [Lautropia sp.]|nr:serine/threonine protein kinase [Lautropia sp.]
MAYPSFEQYNQAFSAHSALLTDPDLRAGTLTTSGLGMPLAISGGFALTYTVNTGSGKFAVRCFHRESKGIERRYSAISKKLASLRSPYFLDFQFQPQGIRVDGAAYPVVKMAWASGTTLGEFLENNLRNPDALGRLADALTKLGAFLHKEGIAHGDLQSGNLMVGRDGSSVQLIDYDGMFVDEIKDLGSAELGHVNFQHPQRKSLNPFDASLDRFSLIVLLVAIRALQLDPTLWNKTNSEADAILFRATDFLDPASSSAFELLTKNSNLAAYAKNFAAVCKSPMDRVPNLADFLAGRNIPTVVIAPSRQAATIVGSHSYVGAYRVLSATDYAACQKVVGDKVEVIGCIVEVKEDKTKKGKPYIFINFGPWKGSIFKVSIWSDGLSHVKFKPDASWVGKWVSVVGLMEPPFVSTKYHYSHLSITVGAAGTITQITEQEAKWRLAGAGKAAGVFTPATTINQQTLDKIRSRTAVAPGPIIAPRAPSTTPSLNAQVLQKIRSASGSATTDSVSSPASHKNNQPSPQQPSVITRVFKWLFG